MSKLISKTEKADCLHKLGYRAALRGPDVLVRNPGGVTYVVSPERGTCSCPASVLCAHLLGAVTLLQDTANALDVQALDELVCVRNCWRYSEAGMKLASKANRLSDRAAAVLNLFEHKGILTT